MRVVMRDGVAYREVVRNSRVPTTRYETREEQQTALVEQTRTFEQTYTRTLYQPMVQQWHRPQMIAWPDGAPQPTMSSQAVAVTRWIPKQETIKVPIVAREIRPAVRTVSYQERILGFEEQPVVVAREVAPEYSDQDVGPLSDNSQNGAIAGIPPVASDYLANGAILDGRNGEAWPNGYSALNGTHYQYGYGAGFPTASQSGWGQGSRAGIGHPVVASNAWPTNNWHTSGWPGSRETSPWAGRGQGSWSALLPSYDTSAGPFGGFGRNLWGRLNAKGTLADFNTSPASTLSPSGGWWNSMMPAAPGTWPNVGGDAFAPPATSYLPPGGTLPEGPGYLGQAPVAGVNSPLAPPATRSGLSADWNGQAPLPSENWLNNTPNYNVPNDLSNGAFNSPPADLRNEGVAPPG